MQPAPDSVPDQFGPYEVYERLGIGGMATVYRAKKRGPAGFERSVALKRMLSHLAEDRSFVESFIREAKVASLLVHPNIAQVYDFGRIGGIYYIAMELVGGFDLRKLLRYANRSGESIPLPAVLSILGELADALEYAHTCVDEQGTPLNIIHRDISPSNVIIAHTGHLKVIDFGIAKAASRQLHTESGQVKGKLGYMSPEAALGMQVGPSTDVFSMGVVAWELVTASPLFSARTDFETMRRIRELVIPPPSHYNPSCPPELDRLILGALERDSDRRLPTAGQFRRGLDAIITRTGGQVSARSVAEWLRVFLQGGDLGRPSGSGSLPEASTAILRPSARARLQRTQDEAQLATEIWGEDAQTVAPAGPDFTAEPSQPYALPSQPYALPAAEVPSIARGTNVPAPLGYAPAPAAAPARPGRRGVVVAIALLGSVAAGLGGALWWKHHRAAAPEVAAVAAAPRGALRFTVKPAGAIIEIGGKEVGRTSPYVAELAPGVYSVTVHQDGYKPWTTTLTVRAGGDQNVGVALEAAVAHVTIDSQPAGLAIQLDGRATPYTTPATFDAPAGPHKLAVTDAHGEVWAQDFTATADAALTFDATFASTAAATMLSANGHHAAVATARPRHGHHASEPRVEQVEPAHTDEHVAQPQPAVVIQPPPVTPVPVPPAPVKPARTPVVPATSVTKIAGELPTLHGDHDAQALVKMCIDDHGQVTAATVVHSTGEVPPNLTSALRGWRYKPYVNQDGVASPACFALSLHLVVEPAD